MMNKLSHPQQQQQVLVASRKEVRGRDDHVDDYHGISVNYGGEHQLGIVAADDDDDVILATEEKDDDGVSFSFFSFFPALLAPLLAALMTTWKRVVVEYLTMPKFTQTVELQFQKEYSIWICTAFQQHTIAFLIVICCITISCTWTISIIAKQLQLRSQPLPSFVYVDLLLRIIASGCVVLVRKLSNYYRTNQFFVRHNSQAVLTVIYVVIVSIYPLNIYLFDKLIVPTDTTDTKSHTEDYYNYLQKKFYYDGFIVDIGHIGWCLLASAMIGGLLLKYQVLYCVVTLIVTFSLVTELRQVQGDQDEGNQEEEVASTYYYYYGTYYDINFVLKWCKAYLIVCCILSIVISYIIELELRHRFIRSSLPRRITSSFCYC